MDATDRCIAALRRMVESTEQWNSAVEKIIGKFPQTGIDLQEAKTALAEFDREGEK